MPCNIVVRKPRESRAGTELISTRTGQWAMWRAISIAMKSSEACQAGQPAAMFATQRQLKRPCATCSRYAELSSGGFAVAHTGNIYNALKPRRDEWKRVIEGKSGGVRVGQGGRLII